MFAVFGLSSLRVVSEEIKKNEVKRVPKGKMVVIYKQPDTEARY